MPNKESDQVLVGRLARVAIQTKVELVEERFGNEITCVNELLEALYEHGIIEKKFKPGAQVKINVDELEPLTIDDLHFDEDQYIWTNELYAQMHMHNFEGTLISRDDMEWTIQFKNGYEVEFREYYLILK